MPQAEFNPIEFAGQIGHLQGTLEALVSQVGKNRAEDSKNFDDVWSRLRVLENRNGWKAKASIAGYGGGAGGFILIVEYLLKHLGAR